MRPGRRWLRVDDLGDEAGIARGDLGGVQAPVHIGGGDLARPGCVRAGPARGPGSAAGLSQLTVVPGGEALDEGVEFGRLLGAVAGQGLLIGEGAEEEIEFQVGGQAEGGFGRRTGLGAEEERPPPLVGDEGFGQRAQGILGLGIADPEAEVAPVVGADVGDAVRGPSDFHRARGGACRVPERGEEKGSAGEQAGHPCRPQGLACLDHVVGSPLMLADLTNERRGCLARLIGLNKPGAPSSWLA